MNQQSVYILNEDGPILRIFHEDGSNSTFEMRLIQLLLLAKQAINVYEEVSRRNEL